MHVNAFWMIFVVLWTRTASVPSVPPPADARALALQKTMNAAIESGQQHLTIEAGKYVFSDRPFTIYGAHNLVIDTSGVTFVFYYGFGLQIKNSHNVTVRGLTLDSDPPNYAQGVVTKLVNSSSFIAHFDDDFIPPDTTVGPFNGGSADNGKVTFWNAHTRLPRSFDGYMRGSKQLDGSSFQILLKGDISEELHEGVTPVTIIPRRGFTWHCFKSSNVLAEDVTIHAGGNMGFLETLGDGGHVYRRVKILRKPGSKGLVALNADGFHSSDVRVGPTLEDSEISFTGDDFVNIHNKMLVVCKHLSSSSRLEKGISSGDSLAMMDFSSGGLADLRTGDKMSFYKLMPGLPKTVNPFLSTGVVVSSELITDADLLEECHNAEQAMQNPPHNAKFVPDLRFLNVRVFRVDFAEKLAENVTASRYNLANDEGHSGSHAVVQRNYFHDSCGSGGRIMSKSSDGTYIDNIAERFGGFHVYSEQQWLEGPLGGHNVYLRNNTVEDNTGGIAEIDVMQGLSNITCLNNTFIEQGQKTFRAQGCKKGSNAPLWV